MRDLNRQELMARTEKLVHEERRITAELIRCLREIDSRRLHLEMGFGSMFDLLVKRFEYSEGAATRRIAAMRLSTQVPGIEQAIETGKLNLSNASQLQHFLQNEQRAGKTYSRDEKTELARKMEHKSRRECERELLALAPGSVLPVERERQISVTQTEIRFVANAGSIAKFDKLKQLLAHHDDLNYAELFDRLADLALEKYDPQHSRRSRKNDALPRSPAACSSGHTSKAATSPMAENPSVDSPAASEAGVAKQVLGLQRKSRHRPYISTEDRRQVWQRAGGVCEYVDSLSGRRCESRWALQIDHIVPHAQGGKSELGNFRLVCRQHNRFLAIKAFGIPLMGRYFGRGMS